MRRVDVKTRRPTPDGNDEFVFYEFKSVKDIPPSNFADQFIKDLSHGEVSDLSQLKWVFDKRKLSDYLDAEGKLPKDLFVDALEGQKDQLFTSDNAKELFKKRYGLKDDDLEVADDFIQVLRDNDDWFTEIFSAAE